MAKRPTGKQLAFAQAYLSNGYNGYQAAKAAGYKGNYNTLAQVASANLRNPKIRALIDEGMEAAHIGKSEVSAMIADRARANMDDFLDDENPEVLDLKKARALGKTHLIKKFTQVEHYDDEGRRTHTTTKVELYSKEQAQGQLMRVHRLGADRLEISGPDGGPIEVQDPGALFAEHYGVKPGQGPDLSDYPEAEGDG